MKTPLKHPLVWSIAVHAILFCVVIYAQFEHHSGVVSLLQVEFASPAKTGLHSGARAAAARDTSKTAPRQKDSSAETADEEVPPSVATGTGAGTSNSAGSASAVSEGAAAAEFAAYISEVTRRVNQNKRYPRVALLREEQGDVLVSFDVAHDGVISNPKVEKRCIFESLNQGALETIQTLGPLPPMPASMSLGAHLHIPIQYRLRH